MQQSDECCTDDPMPTLTGLKILTNALIFTHKVNFVAQLHYHQRILSAKL
jgi:hypothetical protein